MCHGMQGFRIKRDGCSFPAKSDFLSLSFIGSLPQGAVLHDRLSLFCEETKRTLAVIHPESLLIAEDEEVEDVASSKI
ncbi:MAG: hypothetical protein ACREBS_05060 [Nitrososphaerales archaeon]